jgi:hypothetical protein
MLADLRTNLHSTLHIYVKGLQVSVAVLLMYTSNNYVHLSNKTDLM